VTTVHIALLCCNLKVQFIFRTCANFFTDPTPTTCLINDCKIVNYKPFCFTAIYSSIVPLFTTKHTTPTLQTSQQIIMRQSVTEMRVASGVFRISQRGVPPTHPPFPSPSLPSSSVPFPSLPSPSPPFPPPAPPP